MKTTLRRNAKVLAVSLDTKEDLVALKKIIERTVEDAVEKRVDHKRWGYLGHPPGQSY